MGISFLKEMVYEAVISNKTTNLIIGIIRTLADRFPKHNGEPIGFFISFHYLAGIYIV